MKKTCLFSFVMATLLTLSQLAFAQVDDNELTNFSSDGCSMSPNGTVQDPHAFLGCCIAHDIAYWQGGTEEQKIAADKELHWCVEGHSNKFIGEVYFQSVKLAGVPGNPLWFRWGYGWKKHRAYAPLSEKQKLLAQEKLSLVDWEELYKKLLPLNPIPKSYEAQ